MNGLMIIQPAISSWPGRLFRGSKFDAGFITFRIIAGGWCIELQGVGLGWMGSDRQGLGIQSHWSEIY